MIFVVVRGSYHRTPFVNDFTTNAELILAEPNLVFSEELNAKTRKIFSFFTKTIHYKIENDNYYQLTKM